MGVHARIASIEEFALRLYNLGVTTNYPDDSMAIWQNSIVPNREFLLDAIDRLEYIFSSIGQHRWISKHRAGSPPSMPSYLHGLWISEGGTGSAEVPVYGPANESAVVSYFVERGIPYGIDSFEIMRGMCASRIHASTVYGHLWSILSDLEWITDGHAPGALPGQGCGGKGDNILQTWSGQGLFPSRDAAVTAAAEESIENYSCGWRSGTTRYASILNIFWNTIYLTYGASVEQMAIKGVHRPSGIAQGRLSSGNVDDVWFSADFGERYSGTPAYPLHYYNSFGDAGVPSSPGRALFPGNVSHVTWELGFSHTTPLQPSVFLSRRWLRDSWRVLDFSSRFFLKIDLDKPVS